MNGTGRSGTGRLRNFGAMADDKLIRTYSAVVAEADDDEAREALGAEMIRRGFEVATESDPLAELREWEAQAAEMILDHPDEANALLAQADSRGNLTVEDLHRTLEDERHLGYGYATVGLIIESESRRNRLDRAIVAVANELELSYEQLFDWSNSKYGRWLADGVYGRDESPSRATVRSHYLNADVLEVLAQGL